MACGNTYRNSCAKSCVRYYNNNSQALSAGATLQLTLAGSKVVDSGTAIDTEPQSYTTNKTGLYHLSADVVIDGTTAGDVELNINMDGVTLPCTTKTVSVGTGNVAIHTETDLYLTACCSCVSHNFTFSLESIDTAVGNVVECCTGILKIA